MTKDLHPGLGSGALRELREQIVALRDRAQSGLDAHRGVAPEWAGGLKALNQVLGLPALSLSSPIEPPPEHVDRQIRHLAEWICEVDGYSEQSLVDRITGCFNELLRPYGRPLASPGEDAWLDEIAGCQLGSNARDATRTILRAYRANLLAQPTPQASSEIREAKLRELQARLDENIIADTRVCNGQDLQMHRKRKEWLRAQIEAECAALAPSRQGAKIE